MGAGRTGSWDTEVITWEVQEKVRTQGGLAPTTDSRGREAVREPYGLHRFRGVSEMVMSAFEGLCLWLCRH